MATTPDFLKPFPSVHNHDAEPTGIRVQLFLIQKNGRRECSTFPSSTTRKYRDHVFFRQFMPAAHDFFKSRPSGHDLDQQATTFRMAFVLINDVAFF